MILLQSSGNVDMECAEYISSVVSDGIVAESYDKDALEKLYQKNERQFCILKVILLIFLKIR